MLSSTLLVPAAGMPLPDPVTPASPTPTTSAPAASMPAPAAAAPASVPDRVDRRWPANPPWDACPRPVWPGERSAGMPGGGRRVLVIGDSLTRESRTLTAKGMRRHGWTPTFRCWGSRRLDWGIDQVLRSRQLRQLPSFVIVALGTNDISWETQATTERRVRSLLDRLGPTRHVLWVDLHLTRSAWLDARAAWFNDLLHRIERKRPNLTVVDWHRVARAKGIRGWDGIHYGPYGYRLRAATVLKALDVAGRRVPVPPTPSLPTPAPTGTPLPAPPASEPIEPSPTPTVLPSPLPSPLPSAWPEPLTADASGD
jgi:lysophospholipase L1-like esterase